MKTYLSPVAKEVLGAYVVLSGAVDMASPEKLILGPFTGVAHRHLGSGEVLGKPCTFETVWALVPEDDVPRSAWVVGSKWKPILWRSPAGNWCTTFTQVTEVGVERELLAFREASIFHGHRTDVLESAPLPA